jgi:hypothetical protein
VIPEGGGGCTLGINLHGRGGQVEARTRDNARGDERGEGRARVGSNTGGGA